MEPEHRDLVARELGKLGGPGAAAVGARLPRGTCSRDVDVPLPADGALRRAADVLAAEGELLTDPVDYAEAVPDASAHPTVAAVVGSGFLGMNPTLVACSVVATSGDASTTVRVFASAAEGLIRQKSAEKAVRRLEPLLRGDA